MMAVKREVASVNLDNLPEDVIWQILPFTDERDLDNIRLVSLILIDWIDLFQIQISPQWNKVVVEYRKGANLIPHRTIWWTIRCNRPPQVWLPSYFADNRLNNSQKKVKLFFFQYVYHIYSFQRSQMQRDISRKRFVGFSDTDSEQFTNYETIIASPSINLYH